MEQIPAVMFGFILRWDGTFEVQCDDERLPALPEVMHMVADAIAAGEIRLAVLNIPVDELGDRIE